jgi:MarR family transcriptional regulator, organic hydroperoxide resistance regulator
MAKRTTKISGDDKRRAAQLMKRILIGFRTQMDEELRPRGVTTAELQILKAVQNAPGSSGAQLARVCYMTPQSMQSLIQRTEAGGWIERRKGKGNERVLAASLTAAGEALLRDAEAAVQRIEKRVWAGIPGGEIAGMVGLLERCLANIDPE